MPTFVESLSEVQSGEAELFVYLLLEGLPKSHSRVLDAAYPRLDAISASCNAALITGRDAVAFSRVCLAHHGFDSDDWAVHPPAVLVCQAHPDDFVPDFEAPGSPHAGYPTNAVVFPLDHVHTGEEVVNTIATILEGLKLSASGGQA